MALDPFGLAGGDWRGFVLEQSHQTIHQGEKIMAAQLLLRALGSHAAVTAHGQWTGVEPHIGTPHLNKEGQSLRPPRLDRGAEPLFNFPPFKNKKAPAIEHIQSSVAPHFTPPTLPPRVQLTSVNNVSQAFAPHTNAAVEQLLHRPSNAWFS